MKIGLIGGYGLEGLLSGSKEEKHRAEFEDERIKGEVPEYTVIRGEFEGQEILIIPRHGKDHKFPPHTVPFKSYFQFFKEEGVDKVITTNSVGVMKEDCGVPSLFLVEDFVNESKNVTYYDKFPEKPVHINLSEPYDPELKKEIIEACKELEIDLIKDVIYVNSPGPRLETKAEIRNKYSKLGDIIGMTGAMEAILANEKEIPVASIGMGANMAEGLGAKAEFEEIKKNSEKMQEKVYNIIKSVLKSL